MLEVVKKQPAADVEEVVRCKDCKHGDVNIFACSIDGEEYTGSYCTLKNAVTSLHHYCSYGERK